MLTRPQPEGEDAYSRNVWDTAMQAWTIPVGKLAGQPPAATIATDSKGESKADMVWWARPRLVAAPQQEDAFVVLGPDGATTPE